MGGLAKYFRYTLDHKVVGIQYLFGMIIYFLTGGLFAMAIRTELLSPTYHIMALSTYLMVVGEHGTMMMMMMSSVVLGPFGQYFAPDHDRVEADGVPPDRGAGVLAHPAPRTSSCCPASCSAGSPPAGPATRR